jgi:hypothetical protein
MYKRFYSSYLYNRRNVPVADLFGIVQHVFAKIAHLFAKTAQLQIVGCI